MLYPASYIWYSIEFGHFRYPVIFFFLYCIVCFNVLIQLLAATVNKWCYYKCYLVHPTFRIVIQRKLGVEITDCLRQVNISYSLPASVTLLCAINVSLT